MYMVADRDSGRASGVGAEVVFSRDVFENDEGFVYSCAVGGRKYTLFKKFHQKLVCLIHASVITLDSLFLTKSIVLNLN